MRIIIFYQIQPFFRRFHCKNSVKNDEFDNKMLIMQKCNFLLIFYRHSGRFLKLFPWKFCSTSS